MTTTTVLGKTRFYIKGAFDAGATYTEDDLVFYRSAWYRAKGNVPAGQTPPNGTYWDEYISSFNYRGEHVNTLGTAYQVNDVVYFEFDITNATYPYIKRPAVQTYICIADHSADGTNTTLPHNATYWAIMGSSAQISDDVTVATATVKTPIGLYGNDPRKCAKRGLNNMGIVYEDITHPYYGKGSGKIASSNYHGLHWVSQDGQVWCGPQESTAGSTGTGDNIGQGPVGSPLTFYFHDFYRSSSNGGSGVHYTPDGKLPRAIQVERGYSWGYALFNNGEVYAWGAGSNYGNGDRSTTNRNGPVRCGGTYTEVSVAANTTTHTLRDTKIVRISSSSGCADATSANRHILALDDTGGVWAWGYNAYGQCGNNSTTAVQVPTKITQTYFNNRPVVAIWAFGGDYGYNFALNDQNSLYVWGANHTGQLGTGTTSTGILTPTLVTTQTWDESSGSTAGYIRKITSVRGTTSTGEGSTAILTSKGRVYVAGANLNGQFMLGNTAQQNSFTQCSSGPGSDGTAYNVWLYGNSTNGAMMVRSTTDGACYAAGYNGQYLLGDGTATNQTSAVACYIREGGATLPLKNVKSLAAVHSGTNQSFMVVTEAGWVYGIGYNAQYQLGLGHGQTWSYNTLDDYGQGGQDYEPNMYFWLPIRLPNGAMGRIDEVMSMGYNSTTTNNGGFYLRTNEGRLYFCGNGTTVNGYQVGVGQYAWGSFEANIHGSMFRAVPMD